MRLFSRSIYRAILQSFPSAVTPSEQSSFVSCPSLISFGLPEMGVYAAVAFSGAPLKNQRRHFDTARLPSDTGRNEVSVLMMNQSIPPPVQRNVEALLEV